MRKIPFLELFLIATTIAGIAGVAMVIGKQTSPDLQYRYDKSLEPRIDIEDEVHAAPLQPYQPPAMDAAQYEELVVKSVSVYNPESINYHAAARAYEIVLQQLLQARVPKAYQSFHVDLVVQFEQLSSAMNAYVADEEGALEALQTARNDMDQFLREHAWLKSSE